LPRRAAPLSRLAATSERITGQQDRKTKYSIEYLRLRINPDAKHALIFQRGARRQAIGNAIRESSHFGSSRTGLETIV
jgi:hypothetical protein